MKTQKVVEKHNKPTHWDQVLLQQLKSGYSIKQYCKLNNIYYHTFLYWKKKLSSKKGSKLIQLNSDTQYLPNRIFCDLILRDGNRFIFHQQPDVAFIKTLLG